jgi:hypothetical protein
MIFIQTKKKFDENSTWSSLKSPTIKSMPKIPIHFTVILEKRKYNLFKVDHAF